MHVSVIKMLIIKFSEAITDKVLLDNQLQAASQKKEHTMYSWCQNHLTLFITGVVMSVHSRLL